MFNLRIPTALPGVETQLLDPRKTYDNEDQWTTEAEKLARLFIDNFIQYTDTDSGLDLVSAGPEITS